MAILRFCPECGGALAGMREQHGFACYSCEKVWKIYDVITEAATRKCALSTILKAALVSSEFVPVVFVEPLFGEGKL